jgi:hypothetical protein
MRAQKIKVIIKMARPIKKRVINEKSKKYSKKVHTNKVLYEKIQLKYGMKNC